LVVTLERPENAEAVEPRQSDVEDHQVDVADVRLVTSTQVWGHQLGQS